MQLLLMASLSGFIEYFVGALQALCQDQGLHTETIIEHSPLSVHWYAVQTVKAGWLHVLCARNLPSILGFYMDGLTSSII